MQVRSLICTAALTLSLSGGVQAARSLEQVRYALFQDSQALVEEDLRHLAGRGDLGATGKRSENVHADVSMCTF